MHGTELNFLEVKERSALMCILVALCQDRVNGDKQCHQPLIPQSPLDQDLWADPNAIVLPKPRGPAGLVRGQSEICPILG